MDNLSFFSLHLTSALVCLLKTTAKLWRFEGHRHTMPLCAFSASGADGDLRSQLSGTPSDLDLYRICSLYCGFIIGTKYPTGIVLVDESNGSLVKAMRKRRVEVAKMIA